MKHNAQCHRRLVCAITCPAIIMTPLDASTRTIWTLSSSSSSIIIASSSQRRLMFLVLVFSSKQRVIHRSVMNRFSSTDHVVETSVFILCVLFISQKTFTKLTTMMISVVETSSDGSVSPTESFKLGMILCRRPTAEKICSMCRS